MPQFRVRLQHIMTTAIPGLALGLMAVPAFASSPSIAGLDVLRTWNLVVLGDLTSSSEVEGRTFVGGNLDGNSSNYQISNSVSSTGSHRA